MRISIIHVLLSSFFLMCSSSFLTAQNSQDWTFQTLPSNGILVNVWGEGSGWGYAITNKSINHWLWVDRVTTNSSFRHAIGSSDVFDQPVIAPGQSVSVDFDGTQGLYRTVWDSDVQLNFTNSGIFTVSAGWYTADPFDSSNPGAYIGDAGIRIANYSASTIPIQVH